MNFGQQMAKERREERERLYNAIRKESSTPVWIFEIDDKIKGAIITLNQLGYTAEIKIEENKAKINAVKYKRA